MELRLLISWPWDGEMFRDHPGGSDVVTKVHRVEEGDRWEKQGDEMEAWEAHSLRSVDLKREKGVMSQGKQTACRTWKRQKLGVSPGSLKKTCSPSDTLILAQGGPFWSVPTGRRDGTISNSSEALSDIPPPTGNFSTLQTLFSNVGLNLTDLVLLSGKLSIVISWHLFLSYTKLIYIDTNTSY